MNELVGFLLGFSMIVSALVGLAIYADSKSCDVRAASFEAHKYSFIGGCMVKHKGRWLPLENISVFDDKG